MIAVNDDTEDTSDGTAATTPLRADASAVASRRVGRPRILVVRNRFIGDTVLAIPFLRNLRRHFPDAVIDVLVDRGSGEVLADCPYKDELITWHRPAAERGLMPRGIANILATARWIRSRRYDRAYVLKRSFSSAVVCAMARIPHRVGFASEGRGFLFSRAVRIDESRHEAELFLDLLRADGIEVDDGHNENWVAAEAVQSVARVLPPLRGPRVFVAPCSTNPSKQWPLDRFASAIAAIVQARDADIFLCGGPADRATHATLVSMVGPKLAERIHDFSDAFGLRETAALLSRMDLCLGIDTGLVHLAASFGVPVVAVFGPMDPARWGPWKTPHALVRASRSCSPCNLRVPCPINDVCMRDIDIRDVVAAVDGLLESSGAMPAAAGIRPIDLTQGERVYEITFSPSTKKAAADEPATKPLAQAH